MKRVALTLILVVCLIITGAAVMSVPVRADGALDYAENAPGGEVSDIEDFVKAFGDDGQGHPNAEVISGSKTDVRLKTSVILQAPIIIVTGEYRLIGGGCTVARGFSEGPLIILDGSVLANAPSLTIEKPYDVAWTDEPESIVFDGNASNYPSAEGAMISVSGHAYLTVNGNVLFKNASSIYPGGAIYAECGAEGYENTPLIPSVEIRYCKFEDCHSEIGGGAFALEGYYHGTNCGDIKITGTLFENNTSENSFSDGSGGAVYSVGGTLSISGCSFSYNKADRGGAIYSCSLTEILSSTFEYNESNISGGAIYCGNYKSGYDQAFGRVVLNDITATYNKSSGNGGVICNDAVMLTNSFYVTENEASGNGGAIYNSGSFSITEGSVFYNKCQGLGGALYNAGADSVFIMNGGELNTNKASFVAGVYSEGTFKMTGGAIGNNKGNGPSVLIKGDFLYGPASAISHKNTIGLCICEDETGNEYIPFIDIEGELNSLMEHEAYFCREEIDNEGNVTGYRVDNKKGRRMFVGEKAEIESATVIFSVYSEGIKQYKILSDGTLGIKLPLMPLWGWILSVIGLVTVSVGIVIFLKKRKSKVVKK